MNLLFVLLLLIFFTCKRELTPVAEKPENSEETQTENFAILNLAFNPDKKDIILISDLAHVEVAEPGGKFPIIHAQAPADLPIYNSDILVTTDKTVFSRVEKVTNSSTQTRVFYIVLSSKIQNLVSVKYELRINAPSIAVETKLLAIHYNEQPVTSTQVYLSKEPKELNTLETLTIEFLDPIMQNNYKPIFSENAKVFITQMSSLDHCDRKKYHVISATESEQSVYTIEACTAPIVQDIEINPHVYTTLSNPLNYAKERELMFKVKNRPKNTTDLKLNYRAAVPIQELKNVKETTDHVIDYLATLTSIYGQEILYTLKIYTEIQFFVEDLSLENGQISNVLLTAQGGDFCTNVNGNIQQDQIKIKEIEGLTYHLLATEIPNQWRLKIENGLDQPKYFILNFYNDRPNIETYKIEEKNNILWKKQENASSDFDYQEQTAFANWTFTTLNAPKCLELNSIKYPELGAFQVFDNSQGWIKTHREDTQVAYRQWLDVVSCGETYSYCVDFKPIDLILSEIELSDTQALWKIDQAIFEQLNANAVDKIWREQQAKLVSEAQNLQIHLKILNDPRKLISQKVENTNKGKKITLETRFANLPKIDFEIFKAIPIEIWENWQLLEQWTDKKFEIINDLTQNNPLNDFVVTQEFKGELNGNQKTITWKVTGNSTQVALFKKLNKAKISNLKIKDLNLTAVNQVAPIAIEAENSIFENIHLTNIVLDAPNSAGFVYSFFHQNSLKDIHILNLTVEQATLFAGLSVDVKANAVLNLEKISIHDLSTKNLTNTSFVVGLFHNSVNTNYKIDGKIISLKGKVGENFGVLNRALALFDQKQGITNLSDLAIDLNINTNGFYLINAVKDASTTITDLVIYQNFTSTPKLIGNANQTVAKIIYLLNNTPKKMMYHLGNTTGVESTMNNNNDYQLNANLWNFNIFPNLPVLKDFVPQ